MRQKRLKSKSIHGGAKVAAALVLTVAVAVGCTTGGKPEATPAAAQEQAIKTVKVQKLTKQKIGDPLEQVADVAPVTQLDVVSKASGEIKEILKKRGDQVNAGDVILKLDTVDMQLQKSKASLLLQSNIDALNKAKQDLINSKTEMANSVKKMEQALLDVTKAYNKAKNDYDQGLITKPQLDQAETAWKNQTMDLELLKQKQRTLETSDNLAALETQVQTSTLSMQELERSMANLEVKAPVSGVLTELPVVVGMTIQPGVKVGHVQQFDPILIKAQLTENSAKLVGNKQELVYYVPVSTEKAKAKVKYLSGSMDAQSKTYELELETANANGTLKPGTKVQIQLTTEEEQVVLTVPTLSVVREGGDAFVFVLTGDTVEKRKIELGRLNGLNQEVLSGVKEGEQLVVSGQNQLKDKEKVQVAESK
ncbi:efflux RND transporter periplasmic adaptor subunit [Paenibacillus flagellatus]|uniref:Efflux RND transporter periplasmic adaptor subunit n=1 Tax=Paenibacillus flagellatus TaxID=2211139 RepID=A0A2V5JUZ0_9BACL|nr:efflux RND transporter periplasmic adaptor subunit [Paenibacillus flagellatus]PYI50241.1 efflux RND transporter periplasmic adaptor subunit [Paenibacillus flagellatus]